MQRCLITGANRGLGLEFARQLLRRNARVIATARQPGRALELNELAAAHPGRLHILPLDVTAPGSIHELAREAALLFDGLDLLVNNAGLLPSGERFGALDPEVLEASFRTNARGPLLLTEALHGLLKQGERAVVASIGSLVGSIAQTRAFRTPSYAISKAAQNMASRLLAAALAGDGITVLALHPGWVRTEMGGAKAPLAPEDAVARLLAVLDGASIERSGMFLDGDGTALPW
jgi:NAD(P)-dependent dehydrogenase (short-subunit alcohol dehydrogenase family)